jgi:hypothetical protein
MGQAAGEKAYGPQMRTDKKPDWFLILSVFIRVHLRPFGFLRTSPISCY